MKGTEKRRKHKKEETEEGAEQKLRKIFQSRIFYP
jgi:hypothetical protein